MTDFETGAELSITIPERELRQARRDIQDGIGSVNVSIENGRAARPDGGVSSAGLAGGAAVDELGDQTQLLEDILDELDGGVGGGGGGGGGGGLLGGGSGILAGLGLKSALGSVGGGGGLTGLAASNPVATGGLLGLGGAGLLDVFGVDDQLQSTGQDARQSLPFGEEIGDAANFIPGLSIAATLPELGSLDFGEAGDKFDQVWQQRSRVLRNVTGITPADADLFAGDTGSGSTSTRALTGYEPAGTTTGLDDARETVARNIGASDAEARRAGMSQTQSTVADYLTSGNPTSSSETNSTTNVTVNAPIDASGNGEISPQQVQELQREFERIAQEKLTSQEAADNLSGTMQNNFNSLFSG